MFSALARHVRTPVTLHVHAHARVCALYGLVRGRWGRRGCGDAPGIRTHRVSVFRLFSVQDHCGAAFTAHNERRHSTLRERMRSVVRTYGARGARRHRGTRRTSRLRDCAGRRPVVLAVGARQALPVPVPTWHLHRASVRGRPAHPEVRGAQGEDRLAAHISIRTSAGITCRAPAILRCARQYPSPRVQAARSRLLRGTRAPTSAVVCRHTGCLRSRVPGRLPGSLLCRMGRAAPPPVCCRAWRLAHRVQLLRCAAVPRVQHLDAPHLPVRQGLG